VIKGWGSRHLINLILLVSFLVGFLGLSSLSAATIILADFDGSVVEYRPQYQGTFHSHFKLFRIDYRATTLQPIPTGPATIDVSHADMEALENLIGTGNNHPGTLNRTVTLESGETIVPGTYYIRDPDTFERYLEAPAGQNYLLEDFKEAEKLAKQGKGTFKGPYWDHMVAILSTPETAQTFGIITARGHSQNEWRQLFEYWLRKGYIKNLPNFDLIYGVSRREFDRFSLKGKIAVQKTGILEQVALKLGRVPLDKTDRRLMPNGQDTAEMHSLIFVEDTQLSVELAFKKFRALSQSKLVPVKFAIFNAGEPHEIKDSDRGPFIVITDEGSWRPASIFEQVGELAALKKWAKAPVFCHELARAIGGSH
jgi:hypothetical protein